MLFYLGIKYADKFGQLKGSKFIRVIFKIASPMKMAPNKAIKHVLRTTGLGKVQSGFLGESQEIWCWIFLTLMKT